MSRVVHGKALRFARFGEAWVETPEGAFVVAGAIPGDEVRVAPEDARRAGARGKGGGKVRRARLVEILAPSPDRVTPECALADECGGCPLMHASAELEARFKRARVEAALEGATTADGLEVSCHSVGGALGYRRRVRLAFSGGPRPTLGYLRRRSHRVLDVPRCPVLAPPLDAALAIAREALVPSLRGEGELRLALGRDGLPVGSVHAAGAQPPEAYAAAERLVAEGRFAGLALHAGEGVAPATFGDPAELAIGVDGLPMRGPVAGFSQANDAVNRALVEEAVALAEPDGLAVLELYAGAGNLTVPLARRAASITAVEIARDAVDASRANLEARGLSAKLVCAEAAEAPRGRFDVVVLDPPRAGAADAVPRILEARPARIVYVSCDPSTLGRDLRALSAGGYVVDRAHAFDMFPRTAHVEALVRLVKVGSPPPSLASTRARS